jgi:hypothetical protein
MFHEDLEEEGEPFPDGVVFNRRYRIVRPIRAGG